MFVVNTQYPAVFEVFFVGDVIEGIFPAPPKSSNFKEAALWIFVLSWFSLGYVVWNI